MQADPPPPTPRDPGKQLIDGRSLDEVSELGCQVLLERLAALLRPALQRGMNLLRDVPNENVRHAYSMQASLQRRKPAGTLASIR